VTGIREQRERIGEEPANDLDDEEHRRNGQRRAQTSYRCGVVRVA
jgi:hypothetical protein